MAVSVHCLSHRLRALGAHEIPAEPKFLEVAVGLQRSPKGRSTCVANLVFGEVHDQQRRVLAKCIGHRRGASVVNASAEEPETVERAVLLECCRHSSRASCTKMCSNEEAGHLGAGRQQLRQSDSQREPLRLLLGHALLGRLGLRVTLERMVHQLMYRVSKDRVLKAHVGGQWLAHSQLCERCAGWEGPRVPAELLDLMQQLNDALLSSTRCRL